MPNSTRITEYTKIKGTSIKKPAKLATTADIFLSGIQFIDGFTASEGDRILVKNQLDSTENGVYVVSSSSWTRSTDFYTNDDVFSGVRVFVVNGNTNGASEWYVSSEDPISLGLNDVLFTRYSSGTSGSGSISGGTAGYIPKFTGLSGSSILAGSLIYEDSAIPSILIGATFSVHPMHPEFFAVYGGTQTSFNLANFHADIDEYAQLEIQNLNPGSLASTDIVATADNGDEVSYYIDMGINSSTHGLTGGVGTANDAYLYSTGNDLFIGNASENKRLILFTGGYDAVAYSRVYIDPSGEVGINTNNIDVNNPAALRVGNIFTGATPSFNLIIGEGSIDSYLQINIQNQDGGTSNSSDIVATADNGSETDFFINMGINGSQYAAGYIGHANDTYLASHARDLYIVNVVPGYEIKFALDSAYAHDTPVLRMWGTSGSTSYGVTSGTAGMALAGTLDLLILDPIVSTKYLVADPVSGRVGYADGPSASGTSGSSGTSGIVPISGTADNGIVTFGASSSELIVENNLKYDGVTIEQNTETINVVSVSNVVSKQTGITVANFNPPPGVTIYTIPVDSINMMSIDYWIKREESPTVGKAGNIVVAIEPTEQLINFQESFSTTFGPAFCNVFFGASLTASNVNVGLNLIDVDKDETYSETFTVALNFKILKTT
jgi:hypothetical protein